MFHCFDFPPVFHCRSYPTLEKEKEKIIQISVFSRSKNASCRSKLETMTMVSDLPKDLVEEIVCRVPLKSMRSVRLTCKKWNISSKTQSFLKRHLGAREGEYLMIMLMDHNLYIMSVVNGKPSINTLGKLISLNDSEQVNISQVFYCEGLLLCMLEEEDDIKLVVWNPYYGEKRWIKTSFSYPQSNGIKRWITWCYALGYVENKSCHRSYKILRHSDDKNLHRVDKRFPWYEIYDFDSDLWTTLDITPRWSLYSYDLGVSLKGNTYWRATERNSRELDYIICFDFTRERFGPLLRLPFSGGRHKIVILSCVKEEYLAALLQSFCPCEVEIWITTKIEAEKVSWSKFLTMKSGPKILSSLDSFIIDYEKKVAICKYYKTNRYNVIIIGEAVCFRDVDLKIDHKSSQLLVGSYVPSLVQIKQPA